MKRLMLGVTLAVGLAVMLTDVQSASADTRVQQYSHRGRSHSHSRSRSQINFIYSFNDSDRYYARGNTSNYRPSGGFYQRGGPGFYQRGGPVPYGITMGYGRRYSGRSYSSRTHSHRPPSCNRYR